MEKSTKSPQSDSKRLQTILDILQITANRLSKILGYKSPGTVYHVLSGTNQLSPGMINSIIQKFPRINYLYLKTGKGDPLLKTDSEVQSQKNLFGSMAEATHDTEEEVKAGPLYLVHQIQSLISNSETTNKLLQELVEETKKMNKALSRKI